ncbi:MAG: BtpA/SgcQ family protein [Candidatus Humimicrobiaceae bacterium]
MLSSLLFKNIFKTNKPVIGMVHLKPLPGSPLYENNKNSVKRIIEIAIDEAIILCENGVDGIQIENTWDYPYLKGHQISYETISVMTAAAIKIKENINTPIGINCHLNASLAALAIAKAVDAKWIRVFEFVNTYISQSGIVEAIGPLLMRYKKTINAEEIVLLCDVNVKHGSHFIISDRSLVEQANDIYTNGGDAVIITGFETGKPPSLENVEDISERIKLPVFIGSGIDLENISDFLKYCNGFIVGSYFKKNGDWKNVLDPKRIKSFMDLVKNIRRDS